MENLYTAISQVPYPLVSCSQTGFLARRREDAEWNVLPTILLKWSDNSEGTEVSTIFHVTLVHNLCIICISSMDYIEAVGRIQPRAMDHIIEARCAVKKVKERNLNLPPGAVPEYVQYML